MLPKSCSSSEIFKKQVDQKLRKTHSEEGSDIFDYLDNGISRSVSQFSGILQIAPAAAGNSKNSKNLENSEKIGNENGIKSKFVGFFKKNLKIIPVMKTSSSEGKKGKNQENKEKNEEMMHSDAVYEIDELNSTIAPSSSRQCIVGADLESAPLPKKLKKKEIRPQRTEFHPNPPFSCVPIYTAILLGLLIVLIIGAVTTIVDMRPEFIYGRPENENSTLSLMNEIEFSTLKPQ